MSFEEQLNATSVILFLSSFRDASPVALHQWYLSNLNRPIRIGIADPYPWAAVSLTEPRTADSGEADGKRKRRSKKKICTAAILTPLSIVSLTFPYYRVVICLDISRSSFTLTSEGLPFATMTGALVNILEEMILLLQSPSGTAKRANVAIIAHAPETGETFNLWQGDIKEDSDFGLLKAQVRARVDVAEDLAMKTNNASNDMNYQYPDVDTFLKAMMFYLDILPGDACPKAILLTSGCMKVDQCSSAHRVMTKKGVSLHIMVEQLPCDRPIGFYSDVSGLRLLAEHTCAGSLEILYSSDAAEISAVTKKQFCDTLFRYRIFYPSSSFSDDKYLRRPMQALGNHLGTMREILLFTYQCEGATVEHLISTRRAEGFQLVHITHEGPPATLTPTVTTTAFGTQISARTPFTAKAQYLSGLGIGPGLGLNQSQNQHTEAGTVTLHLEKSVTKMSSILYDITIKRDSAAQRANLVNRLSAQFRSNGGGGSMMSSITSPSGVGKSGSTSATTGHMSPRASSIGPYATGGGIDRHELLLEATKEEHSWNSGTITIDIRRKCVRGGRHAVNDEATTKQIGAIAQEILDGDKAIATLLGFAYLPGWIPSLEFAQSFSAMMMGDRASRRASLVSNLGQGQGQGQGMLSRSESSVSMSSNAAPSMSSANLLNMAATDTQQNNAGSKSRGPRWPTAKRIAGLADVLQDLCNLDTVLDYYYFLRASESRVRATAIASLASGSHRGSIARRSGSSRGGGELSSKRSGRILSSGNLKRAFDYVSAKLPNAESKAVTPTKWVYVTCNKNQFLRRSSNPFDVRFGVIMLEANIQHGIFLNLKIYKLAKGCGHLAALSRLAHDSFLYSLQQAGLHAHRLTTDLSSLSIVRSGAAPSIPKSPTIGESCLLTSSKKSNLCLRDRGQLETLIAELVHSKVAYGFQYASLDVEASSAQSESVFEDDFANLLCSNGILVDSSGPPPPPLRRAGSKSLLVGDDVDDALVFVVHLAAVCRKSPAGANMESLLQCRITCTYDSSTVEYYWQKGPATAGDEAKLGGIYSKVSAAASKSLEETVAALMVIDEQIFRFYEVAIPLLRNATIFSAAAPNLTSDASLEEKSNAAGAASSTAVTTSIESPLPSKRPVLEWSTRPAQRVIYGDWENLISRSTNEHITLPYFNPSNGSDSALLNGWLEEMTKDALLKSTATILPVTIVGENLAAGGDEGAKDHYICGSANTLVLIEVPKRCVNDAERPIALGTTERPQKKKFLHLRPCDFDVSVAPEGEEKLSLDGADQQPQEDLLATMPYRTLRSTDPPDAAARNKMCHVFDVNIYSITLPLLTFASTATLSVANARKVLVSSADTASEAADRGRDAAGSRSSPQRPLTRSRTLPELLPIVDRALLSYLHIHLWESHMTHFTTVLGAAMRLRKPVSQVETQVGLDRCSQAVYEVDMSVMCRRKYVANVMNSSVATGGARTAIANEPKGLISLRSAFENSLGQLLLGIDDCNVFVLTRSFGGDAEKAVETVGAGKAADLLGNGSSRTDTADDAPASKMPNADVIAALEQSTTPVPVHTPAHTTLSKGDTPDSKPPAQERTRPRRRSFPTVPVTPTPTLNASSAVESRNSPSGGTAAIASKEPWPTGRAVFVRFFLVARINGDEVGTSTVVQQHTLPCSLQSLTTSLFSLSNSLGQALESMHSSTANSEVALRMVCMYGPIEDDPIDLDGSLHDLKISDVVFENPLTKQDTSFPLIPAGSGGSVRGGRYSREHTHLHSAPRDRSGLSRVELTRVSSIASMRSVTSFSSLHTAGSTATIPVGINTTPGLGPPIPLTLSSSFFKNSATGESASSSLASTPRSKQPRNIFNSSITNLLGRETHTAADLSRMEASVAQISKLYCKGVFFDKLAHEMRVFVASDTLNSLQIASSASITAETLVLVQHCLNDVPMLVKNVQIALDFVSPIAAKDSRTAASNYATASSSTSTFDPIIAAFESVLREEIYGLSKIGDTLYARVWRLRNNEPREPHSSCADPAVSASTTSLIPASAAATTTSSSSSSFSSSDDVMVPCWILINLSHNSQTTGNTANGTATTNMKISISLRRTEIEASLGTVGNAANDDNRSQKVEGSADQDSMQDTIAKQLCVVLEKCSFRVNQRLLLKDLLMTKIASPYLIAPPTAVAPPPQPRPSITLAASTSTAIAAAATAATATSTSSSANATASVAVGTAAGAPSNEAQPTGGDDTVESSTGTSSSSSLTSSNATASPAGTKSSTPVSTTAVAAQQSSVTTPVPASGTATAPATSSVTATVKSVAPNHPSAHSADAGGLAGATGMKEQHAAPTKPGAPAAGGAASGGAASASAAGTKSRIFNNVVPPRKRIMNPALAAIAGQAGPASLHGGSTNSLLGPRQNPEGSASAEVVQPPPEPTTFPPGRSSCQKQGEILCAMQGWAAMLYESAVRHLETSALSQFAVINQDRYFVAQDSKGDIFYMSFDSHSDRDCVRLGVYGVGQLDKQFCEQLQISLEHRLIEFIAKRLSDTISRNVALPPSYLTFLRQSGASRHLVVKFALPNYVQDVYYFCMIARQVLLSSNLLTKLVISGALGNEGKKSGTATTGSSASAASSGIPSAAASSGPQSQTAIASTTTAAAASVFSPIPLSEVLHPAGFGYNLLGNADAPAFPFAHRSAQKSEPAKKKVSEDEDENETDDYFGPDPRMSFTRLSRSSASFGGGGGFTRLSRPGLQRQQHVEEEDMFDPETISPIFYGKKRPFSVRHHERFDERLVVWQQPEFNFLYNVLQPLPAASPQQSKNAVKQIGFGLALVEFYPRPACASQQTSSSVSQKSAYVPAAQTSGGSLGPSSSAASVVEAHGGGGGNNSGNIQILLTGSQHALEEDIKALEAHLKADKRLELLPVSAASAANNAATTANSTADNCGIGSSHTDSSGAKSAGEIHLRISPTVPMQSHVLAEFCQAYFEKALLVYCMERLFSACGNGVLTYPSVTSTPASPVPSSTSFDFLRNASPLHGGGDDTPSSLRRSLHSEEFERLGAGRTFDFRSTGVEDGTVIPRAARQNVSEPDADAGFDVAPLSVQHHLPVPKRRLRVFSSESEYSSAPPPPPPAPALVKPPKSPTTGRTYAQVARGDTLDDKNNDTDDDDEDNWRREMGRNRPGSPDLFAGSRSEHLMQPKPKRQLSLIAPRATLQHSNSGNYSLTVNTKVSAFADDNDGMALGDYGGITIANGRRDEEKELWRVPVNSLLKSTLFADFLRLMHSTIKAAKATPFVLNNSSGIFHFPFLLPQAKAQAVRSQVIDRILELYPFLRLNMVNCLCSQMFITTDEAASDHKGLPGANTKKSKASLLRWCSLRPAANDTANTCLMGVSSISANWDMYDEFSDSSAFMLNVGDSGLSLHRNGSPHGGISTALGGAASSSSRQSIQQAGLGGQSMSPSPPPPPQTLGFSHSVSSFDRQQYQNLPGKHNPNLGYMARPPLGSTWEHGALPSGGLAGSAPAPAAVIPAAMAAAAATHGDLRMLPGFEGSVAGSLPHWLRQRKFCIEVSVNTEGLFVHFFNVAYVHVQALCEIAATTTAAAVKEHKESLRAQLEQLGILRGKREENLPGKIPNAEGTADGIPGASRQPLVSPLLSSNPAVTGSALHLSSSVAGGLGGVGSSSAVRSSLPVTVQSPLPSSIQSSAAAPFHGAKIAAPPSVTAAGAPNTAPAPPAKLATEVGTTSSASPLEGKDNDSSIRWVENVLKKLCWENRTLYKLFGKPDAEKTVPGRSQSSRNAASRAEEIAKKEESECLNCIPLAAWRRGTVKSTFQVPLPVMDPASDSSNESDSLQSTDRSFLALCSILRKHCESNDCEYIESSTSSTVFVAAPVPRTAVVAVTEVRLIRKKPLSALLRRDLADEGLEPLQQQHGSADADYDNMIRRDSIMAASGSSDVNDPARSPFLRPAAAAAGGGKVPQKVHESTAAVVSPGLVGSSGPTVSNVADIPTEVPTIAPRNRSASTSCRDDGSLGHAQSQKYSSAALDPPKESVVMTTRLVDIMEIIKSVAGANAAATKHAATQLVVKPSLAIHKKGAEQLQMLTADALSEVTTAAVVLEHPVVKKQEKELLACVMTLLHQAVLQRLTGSAKSAGAQALKVLQYLSPLLKDSLTFFEMEVPLTSTRGAFSSAASSTKPNSCTVGMDERNLGISARDVVAALSAVTDGMCTSQNGNYVQIWRDTVAVLAGEDVSVSGGDIVCFPFECHEELPTPKKVKQPRSVMSRKPSISLSSSARRASISSMSIASKVSGTTTSSPRPRFDLDDKQGGDLLKRLGPLLSRGLVFLRNTPTTTPAHLSVLVVAYEASDVPMWSITLPSCAVRADEQGDGTMPGDADHIKPLKLVVPNANTRYLKAAAASGLVPSVLSYERSNSLNGSISAPAAWTTADTSISFGEDNDSSMSPGPGSAYSDIFNYLIGDLRNHLKRMMTAITREVRIRRAWTAVYGNPILPVEFQPSSAAADDSGDAVMTALTHISMPDLSEIREVESEDDISPRAADNSQHKDVGSDVKPLLLLLVRHAPSITLQFLRFLRRPLLYLVGDSDGLRALVKNLSGAFQGRCSVFVEEAVVRGDVCHTALLLHILIAGPMGSKWALHLCTTVSEPIANDIFGPLDISRSSSPTVAHRIPSVSVDNNNDLRDSAQAPPIAESQEPKSAASLASSIGSEGVSASELAKAAAVAVLRSLNAPTDESAPGHLGMAREMPEKVCIRLLDGTDSFDSDANGNPSNSSSSNKAPTSAAAAAAATVAYSSAIQQVCIETDDERRERGIEQQLLISQFVEIVLYSVSSTMAAASSASVSL